MNNALDSLLLFGWFLIIMGVVVSMRRKKRVKQSPTEKRLSELAEDRWG